MRPSTLAGTAAALIGAAFLIAAAPSHAQSEAAQPAGCDVASAEVPATPPAPGPGSGTAPGGDGSTGWTGGTGGSNIGTTPAGPTPASPTEHPETASGLDPVAGAAGKTPAC